MKLPVKTPRLFRRRALLLAGMQLGVTATLAWRMNQLGVKESDKFRLLAEENRINIRLQPPSRGIIYDRSGNTLALNRQVYTIEIVREQATDPEAVLRRLAELIPLSKSRISEILVEISQRRAFVPVTVATGLEWEHIAAVSANSPSLPGIIPKLGLNRKYPIGADFAHVIGYVGPVSDYDLSQIDDKDPLLLIPRFQIGKNGIEAKVEKPLRGQAGFKTIEVNSVGRVMRVLKDKAGLPGVNLQLTIGHDLQRFATERMRAFVPVTVATGLEWEHIAAVSANSPSLPGIIPKLGLNRKYPIGADFAHVIGYVGPVSDYDLSQIDDKDPLLLIPRFQIGKNGIEAKVEKPLRGQAGFKTIEVNSVGRVMRVLKDKAGLPGVNLQLTIGHDLQRFATERMQGESSAAVVMDVNNGDILALASAPTFDPNKFVNGISVTDWEALNDNKYRPLANKTVQGTYPPGSTFKMVVALAALTDSVINKNEEVFCPGHKDINGRKFHCWRKGGHGKVTLREALRYSCDVFFYDIAIRVGIERITETAKALGLGVKHDLPLPAVRSGLMPTKEWKQKNKKQDWFIGDTANAGIGQGFVLASPLQLATMTARLASGLIVQPRMLNMIDNKATFINHASKLDFKTEHLNLIRSGMYDVSNHPRGTAFSSRLDKKYKIAGKTGTSQVRFISKKERETGVTKNEDLPWNRRDHALFVGYAPYKNPRYSISVIVEHGGAGSRKAAPIARDIMEKALSLGENSYGPLPNQIRSNKNKEPGKKA